MTTPNQLWPAYTFQLNLVVLNRYNWSLPNRTTLDGNETVTEESNIPNTMTSWLPGLFPGVANIAEHNGFTFTAYGMQAIYLRSTYCSNPPNPLVDPLILLTPAPTPQFGRWPEGGTFTPEQGLPANQGNVVNPQPIPAPANNPNP